MTVQNKVKSREDVVALSTQLKSSGKRIGFTSGVFDLLHPGHVDYLEQARALCDVLIVGLNSDASVKSYKTQDRPFVNENDRARVLAALSNVDYVFIFSERRNAGNIEALKPDFYIKAGDYAANELSSAPLVEQYGGKVVIIPAREGYSSTKLIEKIANTAEIPRSVEIKRDKLTPAIFVDRDGVINEEIEYLHEPDKFKLIPGGLEALKRASDAGYRIVVITNQAGIGLGYFTKEDLFKVNKVMLAAANTVGLQIDRVYFCPHSQADKCSCRKPEPGMILRGAAELGINLGKSFVIGDRFLDVRAAERAGVTPILVATGHAGKDLPKEHKPQPLRAANLAEAVGKVLKGIPA